jgi:hypothetical protein
MNKYLVSWVINAEAESPEEAALEARKMQIMPTEALYFITHDLGTGEKVAVSLKREIEH